MKEKIKVKFKELEKTRQELFINLNKLGNDKLNFKIDEYKWSIIQIIHHLYKSEQLSVVYIKRKLSGKSKVDKAGMPSLLRGLILEWILRFPVKLKAPENVSNVPDIAGLEEYFLKWNKLRNELSEILENTDIEILKSDIFKHPAIGHMNMLSALKFMLAHFNHHKKQIDKILLFGNN